jgi:hypothetical protein
MPFEPCQLKYGEDGDEKVFLAKVTGYGYNDMISLPTLTKDSILDNLKKRFKSEMVYTYVGDIVVSVNPFKNTGCVGSNIRARYKGGQRTHLPPHIYALVDQTYNTMVRDSNSQSILISGESGAGKTEAMKICLTYISQVATAKGQRVADEIAPRLMMTNPIMEGLGNAKTIRNNNSSRFGKHFDIQFGPNGNILGAFTSVYLLEKPRICNHLEGERNYHIFYMLCKSEKSIRESVGITKWQDYYICNQKGTVAEVTTWNDESEFKDCHAALSKLGFSDVQRTEMYTMLSLCLNLGNLAFKPGKEGSDIPDQKLLAKCAKDLQVDTQMLNDAIVYKTMGGGKLSTYKSPLEPKRAEVARNSLVMHIYSLVFDWCTHVINEYISIYDPSYCTGVLDIFGFENFGVNSFPQLCINFTNESLHNLFIEHVFKLEQEVYVREEVEWNFVSYEDNQHVIDLIAKRPVCVLGLLDEGSATGSGKDSSVLENCHSTFGQGGKYKAYIKPKKSADRTFVLSHYAGEVVYTIEGWIEKNKDELSADITAMLEVHSEFEKLKELAQEDTRKKAEADEAKASTKKRGGGGKKKKTVAKVFQESLNALMEKLRTTEHHYIRCLKPNQTLKAGDWDNDFMFKQLAYSGTLEVTQIRKAGLNVRRPLKHFYQYYKVCADDPAALKAGTVTKRTELLLKQLGIDENQYRVGKTLLFLQNFDLIDALDKLREEKVLEYVIVLQSFMRMLKDYRKYRILYRAVLRMQGFCKSWEIRRAYMEVRSAAKVFQKHARSYLAHQKLLDMKESEDPALTKEKKKEEILKILYPERFGRGKMNLSGKRRPMRLQPVKVAGDDEGDVEYLEMPKFAIVHEGWLNVKIGMMGKWQKTYVALKQGTLTLFEDHESLTAIISYNMANCLVKAEDSQIVVTRTEKLYKHKVRSFRDMGRRIKGPLWGQDVILFQITPDIKEAGKVWADKLEESLCEAKLVDSYKMQVNLDGDDDEKPVNQKVASIIKEGYLRKKKPGNSAVQDMKRTWERRYFVLYNDGKLKYYDSRAKGEEKGSLDMRFFAIQEIEEEMEVDDEDEAGGEKQSLKVQGQFFKIMKGKQFGLYSGKHCFYMASPEREVCDEWISTLQTTLSILYQKSPLFSQDFLRVYMMDGTFTTMPLTETTKTRDVVKFMCKKHTLNNESEFGLLELWDHPGINGNMSERKLPNDELLLDQTMLTWEQAARKRFGIVNTVPHTAFKLVMRKLSSLLPQARTKKEQHLEFCQAMADLKDGRFTVEDKSEIFDLAALAIFKDLQEGLSEAEQEEELVLEEGQLTAQLHHYLPSYWFKALENKKSSMRQQQIEEWDRKVVQSFNELTRSELREDECITEVRKIVYSFRLETELNALASTRMFIERVRLAPLCFSAQYIAEMWSVDKILKVLVVINAGGFHVYRLGGAPLLLSTFNFETLVSWQSMNDMLIINIIYTTKMEATKRREKLRFLTRESMHMKNLLSKYGEVVLQQVVKRMKEREARMRQQEEDDDDDD